MDLSEAINRWTQEIIPGKQELLKALKTRKLTIYHGVDPTGPDLHLGHSTNYLLMRALQDAGHKVILLVGDFTARIGDPSDKVATRKKLSEGEIKKNLLTYKDQISKILSVSGKNPAEIIFNSKWLAKLTFADVVELASSLTVQQMLERDFFQHRLKENKPIYLHEFLYPLMQGYDSVAMEVDAEIGGTDQTFNMLVGRTFVKKILGKEKFIITTPFLINPKTGKKLMSKSEGNYVALNDSSHQMYGKVMTLPDETIHPCFLLCTTLSESEIQSIETAVQSNEISIMKAKKRLAWEIVKLYHGEKEANNAQKEFEDVFQKGSGAPEQTPFLLNTGEWKISDALVQSGALKSRSEAKRIITSGGTVVAGPTEFTPTDPNQKITITPDTYIRVGKTKFIKPKI